MNKKAEIQISQCLYDRLTFLNLYDCELSKIPGEVLELDWITELDLSFNKNLSDLRPLEKLTNLKYLIVSSTQVDDLRPLKSLTNLEYLDIRHTLIADLLPILSLIKKGIPVKWDAGEHEDQIIRVGGERSFITSPPREIIEQGNEAILRYFEEKKRLGTKSTIKVREAKLLIVGQGGAGKTTLRDKLISAQAKLPPPDATTIGIEIRCLNETMPDGKSPFRLNIWDFGGQNIQHYAHQFFLTGSALYTLVTNEREQNANFQYWLNIIEMLGRDSPVIIVQNKIAGHFDEIRNAAAIRERFGNVLNRFFALDLKDASTSTEFRDLRREILFRASQLPHVEREYLSSFVAIREKVETAAATGMHFLSWTSYLALGAETGIKNENLMKDYANAFTFLGVCQYFPDDIQLCNFVFLNPKWIIDALFQLLYHEKVEMQHGVFEEKDTLEIWKGKDYRGMEGHLVRMIENFELCYPITGDARRYIVPQKLPAAQNTYNWGESNATPLLYEYKFMPKGIVTRLTCRLHARIEDDHVWNDAVIFTQPDGKARVFVREVYGENKIELRAAGENRSGLFNEIIQQIDNIHITSKFANLQVDKKVPCCCNECTSNPSRQHFYKYELLEKAIEKGKIKVECGTTTDDVRIAEIFGRSGVKRPDISHRLRKSDKDEGIKRHFEEILAQGDIGSLLKLMQAFFRRSPEVLLQQNRLKTLEKEERAGKLSSEEYLREKNRIADGCQKILEDLWLIRNQQYEETKIVTSIDIIDKPKVIKKI